MSQAAEPVRYVNRATGAVETEQIFGETWLRWAYENPLGRLSTWAFASRALFSHWFGWRMNMKFSAQKVLPFVLDYNLDATEFAKLPYDYKTFNEFFCRALKPGARPIAAPEDPSIAVLPADGRHLAFANAEEAGGFYVKGERFTPAELLGGGELADTFRGGSLIISRLCPVDYHRFHFPVAGIPSEPQVIRGPLYSVSPIALRRQVRYLVMNKRAVTVVTSPEFGQVAMVEIGATCVGTIKNLFVAGRPVAKGEEKGMFKFGGSCVATVFQKDRIRLDADLRDASARNLETYAKMGERLGVATSR
jgi:phosphatidylserine decarboxylase